MRAASFAATDAGIRGGIEACYPALKAVKVDQFTADEMGANPLAKWITWL
jgi:hypothetical protein